MNLFISIIDDFKAGIKCDWECINELCNKLLWLQNWTNSLNRNCNSLWLPFLLIGFLIAVEWVISELKHYAAHFAKTFWFIIGSLTLQRKVASAKYCFGGFCCFMQKHLASSAITDKLHARRVSRNKSDRCSYSGSQGYLRSFHLNNTVSMFHAKYKTNCEHCEWKAPSSDALQSNKRVYVRRFTENFSSVQGEIERIQNKILLKCSERELHANLYKMYSASYKSILNEPGINNNALAIKTSSRC